MTRRDGWRPAGWGPDRERPRDPSWGRVAVSVVVLLVVMSSPRLLGLALVCAAVVLIIRARRAAQDRRFPGSVAASELAGRPSLAVVLAEGRRLGGGVYLGAAGRGWRLARAERAVLLLGPPRSGKTSGVIVPALLAHDGPAVSTSTKPDVLYATAGARSELGRIWRFDPTGAAPASAGEVLRWSPVAGSRSWDGALLMARAMVTGAAVGTGTTDQTHWSRRAQAALAPLLHAAALSELGIDRVCRWVLSHELDAPRMVLENYGAELAAGVLVGLQNTEGRERSSILSAAADALDAYSSEAALAAASDPNFDPDEFVRSRDTVYIHAPAEQQQLAAPLVCGLLSQIRAATYRAHAAGHLSHRVLFALDEAANIAPLAELPAIASEGGGQGLALLCSLQDLSQARARWGPAADGFLTLFGAKLILPGIADERTLESVSVALGEYDRQMTSHTRGSSPAPSGGVFGGTHRSRTVSIQRQRVLSPGEIAGIPAGHGLHLDGVSWELLRLTPAHTTEPWRTLTSEARS